MQYYEFEFSGMGSPCALNFYYSDPQKAKSILQLVVSEVQRLEQKYSRYLATSLLTQINGSAGKNKTLIDPETYALLAYAEQAYQISEQLFDITTGVLRHVWDFKKKIVPSDELIAEKLQLVNWQAVQWNEKEIYLEKPGMEIDFGGIVKEYAADSVARILSQYDVLHGLIDLGGDIHVVGPHPDGKPWLIGITNPEYLNSKTSKAKTSANSNNDAQAALANIPMTSGGLASSGDYQRYFVLNGQKYSHILNPKTGWPALGLSAVSVWCEQCVMAGTLATVAMLKQHDGIPWLKELEIPFVALNTDGELHSSK